MIRNIVLDMGMVLLDYNPYLACLRHAGGDRERAKRLGEAIFYRPEWGQLIDGGVMTDIEYAAVAWDKLESPEDRQLAEAILRDWWLDGLYPKSGIQAVLERMLNKGFRLYVLSNTGYSFHSFSYKIPCFERFSGTLISAEEQLMKPDPAIFLRLCERFGLTPEECLFVDDLAHNVEGAESAGMRGYCFADGDVARLAAYIDGLNG